MKQWKYNNLLLPSLLLWTSWHYIYAVIIINAQGYLFPDTEWKQSVSF